MNASSPSKLAVAGYSILASAVLAVGKLVIALLTGSLGVLSEALHSCIDFLATVMTWFAVRWGDQPADDDHHYGHAKIESIAALLEALFLLLTALYVGWEAINRLLRHEAPADVPWWAPALLIVAVLVDFNRSRALAKVAQQESSDALAADAAHFESDMYASLAVLAGLLGLWLGFTWADSVAALVVALFILWIGFKLVRSTLETLLDRAPDGLSESLRDLAAHEPGVLAVNQMRLRQAGSTAYVDMTVDVSRGLSAVKAAALRERLNAAIIAKWPRADLSLTLNPVALDTETAFDKAALIAAEQGLSIHHLIVQDVDGRLAVSFDVELGGDERLDEAHAEVTQLEAAIRDGLGGDVEVESHIEPKPLPLMHGQAAGKAVATRIGKMLQGLAAKEGSMTDVHNIRVRDVEGGYYVHYHCRFAPSAKVRLVHDCVDRVENRLMEKEPRVRRVVAHAEPVGLARHKL
jgi:cation diffusion facilitator family transporter